MIRYWPFPPTFDLKMGTAPLRENDTIVESDGHYVQEVHLKRSLLREDHSYYYDERPGTRAAAWDVVDRVLKDLVRNDPSHFQLTVDHPQWSFENQYLGEKTSFVFGQDDSLPYAPLDWVGRQVQEDLVILNAQGDVVAGQLCFPSGWALHEKMGKQFMEVHAPLPALSNPMIQSANKLLERLPLNKPIVRNNWGFRLGDQLDLSTKHAAAYRNQLASELPGMTMDAFGDKIYLRLEHQTLTRLSTGDILFTIHTFNSPLKEEVQHPDRAANMLSFLKSTPKDLLDYKIITPYYQQLIEYLESHANR